MDHKGCLYCGRCGNDIEEECPGCGKKDGLVTFIEAVDILMSLSLHRKRDISRILKEIKDNE